MVCIICGLTVKDKIAESSNREKNRTHSPGRDETSICRLCKYYRLTNTTFHIPMPFFVQKTSFTLYISMVIQASLFMYKCKCFELTTMQN